MANKKSDKKKSKALNILDIIIGLFTIAFGIACLFNMNLLPGAGLLLSLKFLFSGIMKKKSNDSKNGTTFFILFIITLIATVIYTLDRFNVW